MKFYTKKQIKAIEEQAFTLGYRRALTDDISGVYSNHQNHLAINASLDLIPKMDIQLIIKKVISKVYSYMANITNPDIAKKYVKELVDNAMVVYQISNQGEDKE